MNTTKTFETLGKDSRVDRGAGIIRNVSLMTVGQTRNSRKVGGKELPLYADATTTAAICKNFDRFPGGVKVKSSHKGGALDILGAVKNPTMDAAGNLRGDFEVVKTHADAAHLFNLAETMPETFGLSCRFDGDDEILPDKILARCSADGLFSIDLAADPAANPSGLFESEKISIDEIEARMIKAETAIKELTKEPKKMNELETAQASIKDLQTKLTAAEKLAEDEMAKNQQAVKDLEAAKAKITELETKAATDAKNFAAELTAKESSVESRAKLKAAELAGQAGSKAAKSFEAEEKAKHEAGGGAAIGNDIAAAKAAREARKGSTVKSWNTSLPESAKNMAR